MQSITTLDFINDPAERSAILSGTSTADHTYEIQSAIDAAGSTRRLCWLGTVNTGALSSADSIHWEFEGSAKIRQIAKTYTSAHITLSGANVHIEKGEFDGNQNAMVAGQGSGGLLVTGATPTLIGVKCHGYNGTGYTNQSSNIGTRRGLHIGCSFDDNAGLGVLTSGASYLDFISCTFDRNGYGFQRFRVTYADASHGFVAFGVSMRLRSHHITLSGCHARDNGRDGFNVNQGSYAIKFGQCLAHGNDDGGFTVASDNTNSNLPGEGEACYDLEYVDCESYNNYASGLAVYQTAHNITVIGGRFYNNNRVAGNQAVASSYYNGIFVAGGSTGINIDTKCYDDRQFLQIGAVSDGVLTVPGWTSGQMTIYPKVAIYSGSDQAFRGYGKITSESDSRVSIMPTAYNGVVFTSILPGDYVTQAVQHCGVLVDNDCKALIAVEGAGHRIGPSGASGRNVYSGAFAHGQNVLQPKERASFKELLLNPGFDSDLLNWTFNTPGGGSATYNNTGFGRRSGGALKLTAGTAEVIGDAALVPDSVQALSGEFCEAGIWAYANTRDAARFSFFWTFDGSTYFSTTVQHPGAGWRYLKIGAFLPANTAGCFCRVAVEPGKTVYYDDASLRVVQSYMDQREFMFPTRSLPY